jgi:hypothetical protein
MSDIKAPVQNESNTNRAKQVETPALQYIDLTTGQICADGFEPLPNAAVEDPNVNIRTKRLSGTSAKPQIIGTQK